MPSSTLRIAEAESESRSPRRCASMCAMGASSRGAAWAGAPIFGARNASSQCTSGVSTATWRRFQPTPSSATPRMRPFSTGLVAKAVASCGQISQPTPATRPRNTTMRNR